MRSYSSKLLMCACSLNSDGHWNLRCSCRVESMLGLSEFPTALSGIMRPRDGRGMRLHTQTKHFTLGDSYQQGQAPLRRVGGQESMNLLRSRALGSMQVSKRPKTR